MLLVVKEDGMLSIVLLEVDGKSALWDKLRARGTLFDKAGTNSAALVADATFLFVDSRTCFASVFNS